MCARFNQEATMNDEKQAQAEGAATNAEQTYDGATLDSVTAETITMNGGSIRQANAVTINLNDGGIAQAQAGTITVNDGGIALAKGDTISVSDGGIAAVMAQRAVVNGGSVAFLAAGEVSGDAKILIDMRAAAVFGVVVGLMVGLFKLLAGRQRA
jgi:hypothetical protein